MKKRYYFSSIFTLALLVLIGIFLISGCAGTPSGVGIEIKSAENQAGNILLTLKADKPVEDVRIDILNSEGQILCTKYKILSEGTNNFEFTDCQLEKKIKVSVSAPKQPMVIKGFTLNLPTFTLQKGFKYDYAADFGSPGSISIYVTEETTNSWEGIIISKEDPPGTRAIALRFKISKSDLNILVTYPLNTNQILQTNPDYKEFSEVGSSIGMGVFPFWLIVIKNAINFEDALNLDLDELFQKKIAIAQQPSSSKQITFKIEDTLIRNKFLVHQISITQKGGGDYAGVEIYASMAKPYLLIDLIGPKGKEGLSFKGLEKKDFSLSDYTSYTFEEYKPRQLEIPSPP